MPDTNFLAPLRPDFGKQGDQIVLRANHFRVIVPGTLLHHYEVFIQPDKCPRRVNRYDIYAFMFMFTLLFDLGYFQGIVDGCKSIIFR